ncbi:MAG: hypothetical protein HFJ09_11415 [Lachnospiraceae bacterium]|nr:hypothetical protein [Lachnospiraceae bacterium]
MSKFWKILLQRKKIMVSFAIVVILWGLAAVDRFGDIFVWETFLPGISQNVESNADEGKELFEKCQGEDIMEYYEGMGSSLTENNIYKGNIKLWIENILKESFPREEWEIKEYPQEETEGKKEILIENKNQTIFGKVRLYKNQVEKNSKKYMHFAFHSKGREDSLYSFKKAWGEKMEDEKVLDYKDYYYRTFCFRGKLTQGQQKQAAKQYCQCFGIKKSRESMIDDMVNVYGFTEKFCDSVTVEGEKINFQIAFSYNETEDNTRLYLATPFLNTDY